MKIIISTLILLTFTSCRQELPQQKQVIVQPKISLGEIKNITAQERTIHVEGSAEMEIIPDKIEVNVYIKEYYKEEFEKYKKRKHWKTRVPLAEIEADLMEKLNQLGIHKKNIITNDVGSYYREERKSILIGKNFTIKIKDPKIITQIISNIRFRGVESVTLGEIDNTQIKKYRIQLKKEALIAAKMKAEYLLESVGKKTGDIINISEGGGGQNYNTYANVSYTCNSSSSASSNDNFRKINLSMEIQATFEILDK
jgi:uncharacterized protein